MILILYIALREIVSCEFIKYVQIFGLSLMIVGVALTIISCVNYTVQAIKKMTAKEEMKIAAQETEE